MARDRDRDDDRFDDEMDETAGPLTAARLKKAKDRVKAPAIILIVHAVLGLLGTVYAITQLAVDPVAQVKQERAKAEANMNAQQQQQVKGIYDGLEAFMEYYAKALPALIGMGVVVGLLTLIGAVSMLKLSGSGMAKLSAVLGILSIVCCGSGCCLVGLMGGIWSFSAMGDPDVKAAFAAGGKLPVGRDDRGDE